MLEEKLLSMKLKPSHRIFRKLLPNYEVTSKDELYSQIATGIINLDDLKKVLKQNTKNKWINYWGFSFIGKSKLNELKDDGSETSDDLPETTSEAFKSMIPWCWVIPAQIPISITP